MTDPVSDLAACRQRLDALEQQAKAAGVNARPERWWEDQELRRKRFTDADAAHIASWSPAAVLTLVGWIRQTLDGAEATLERHRATLFLCDECAAPWPCPDAEGPISTIDGLAAVLAEQAVK